MATIPWWVSFPMFIMTRNRLKEVSVSSDHSVCHFLPLFEPPRRTQNYRNPNLWLPYLAGTQFLCFWFNDKSIRSCLKFIRPSGVPLLPLFATIGATAERKIIEILIHDYHVPCWVPIPMFLMTINRLKVVSRLLNYPVCYFLPLLRPLRSPKLSKSNGPIKLSYNGAML